MDHVDPVEEVLAEAPRLHLLVEVLVGGGDDPDVHRLGPVLAHARHLSVLQRAQELHLERVRHLPDLVEEEGPAVRRLELPRPGGHRPGEGALGVPE